MPMNERNDNMNMVNKSQNFFDRYLSTINADMKNLHIQGISKSL